MFFVFSLVGLVTSVTNSAAVSRSKKKRLAKFTAQDCMDTSLHHVWATYSWEEKFESSHIQGWGQTYEAVWVFLRLFVVNMLLEKVKQLKLGQRGHVKIKTPDVFWSVTGANPRFDSIGSRSSWLCYGTSANLPAGWWGHTGMLTFSSGCRIPRKITKDDFRIPTGKDSRARDREWLSHAELLMCTSHRKKHVKRRETEKTVATFRSILRDVAYIDAWHLIVALV